MEQIFPKIDFVRFLRRKIFDNRRYWNDRYLSDPGKGSGPGSRGEFLTLKRDIILSTIAEFQTMSILDIGCGDIAALDSLNVTSYIGVDISKVVVERNRTIRPDWRFICEDITNNYRLPPAQLVLCLDVLIHQKSSRDYYSVLSNSLNAAQTIALISGYARPDSGWNVYFHEPIMDSICRLSPHSRAHKIAEYRGIDLLRIQI